MHVKPMNRFKAISFALFFFSGIIFGQTAAAKNPQATQKDGKDNSVEILDILSAGRQARPEVKKIETEFFNVEFDSKGGVIRSFKHKDSEHPLKNNVDIVMTDPFFYNVYKTPESEIVLRTSQYRLSKQEDGTSITIKATLPVIIKTKGGLLAANIVKTYQFSRQSHYWEFSWDLENRSAKKLSVAQMYFMPLNNIGPASLNKAINDSKYLKSFYYLNDKFHSQLMTVSISGKKSWLSSLMCSFGKQAKVGGTEPIEGNLEFFGVGSRFMLMAIQPLTPGNGLTLVINHHEKKEIHAHLDGFKVDPRGKSGYKFIVYTGPKVNKFFDTTSQMIKDQPYLKLLNKDLYKAFDFGVTAPIRDIIVAILKLLYKVVHNYGVAIVLLVVGLRLLFYPLNQAQATSMKKMQVLQPKMKEINEKYKNNPQEKQKRIMAMYKEHKVNPMGGCLPMVIQIPILIALISAFSDSYELWGSPFIHGWINDLSEPDTIYTFKSTLPIIGGFHLNILPIIMLFSQFLQSKFTVVSQDKNQKMLMQLLPVLMVAWFWSMPSGVVLYWILFNFLSVFQQIYTNKKQEASPVTKSK